MSQDTVSKRILLHPAFCAAMFAFCMVLIAMAVVLLTQNLAHARFGYAALNLGCIVVNSITAAAQVYFLSRINCMLWPRVE